MKNLLADLQIAPNGGFKGLGTSGLANPTGTGITDLSTFISTMIGVMTIVAFIWFVFVIFTGAIGIISSGGDKQALESAKKKITSGIIGVVIVIAAIFIIDLVGTIFGINILNIFQLFYRVTGLYESGGALPPGIN